MNVYKYFFRHPNLVGLQQAKQLATNLIDTVSDKNLVFIFLFNKSYLFFQVEVLAVDIDIVLWGKQILCY